MTPSIPFVLPPFTVRRRRLGSLLTGVALLAGAASAVAQPASRESGIVRLSSSATVEVAKDLMTLVFGTTRDGPDAATVQAQLKQALDAALVEARRVARPGQLDLQTGNFAITPRYGGKGAITGWQGSVELLVEGRDMAAIGQLAGRITTLSIARVGYGLSRELRERSESELGAQAIARYRSRAAEVARAFGYAGAEVVEVSVSSADGAPPVVMLTMRRAAMATSESGEALAVEAGKGSITVMVDGTVRMTR